MSDETETRPAGAPDGGGHPEGGGGVGSPLQARGEFLKNWDWQSVVGINRGACERGGAQHGTNSDSGEACAREWEGLRPRALTLGDTLDRLRAFHRKAPFLFFNGNTFATLARELAFALFSDVTAVRKREIASAIAHYVAGVLDRENMACIVESLSRAAVLMPGDRVKTLRGTLRGVIIRVLPDGRILWRPDGAPTELIALPESLLPS